MISIFCLFYITLELNLDISFKDDVAENDAALAFPFFTISVLVLFYLFLFFFILNYLIYRFAEIKRYDNFIFIIKWISIYMFAIPIFSAHLILLSSVISKFGVSLLLNIYALIANLFVLRKYKGENHE
jgi:hypothetical protein